MATLMMTVELPAALIHPHEEAGVSVAGVQTGIKGNARCAKQSSSFPRDSMSHVHIRR